MSLAAQIRELIDGELTNREIAEQLDCCQDYVRATRGRYLRPHVQRAWRWQQKKDLGDWPETVRYRSDPAYRARHAEYQRRSDERRNQAAA